MKPGTESNGLVDLIFLGDWRASIVVACTIPLSLLFGFLGMDIFGISVNLMSLGAIDFGTLGGFVTDSKMRLRVG